MLFGSQNKNIKTVYYKKKKELEITGLNSTMVEFLKLVGNKTIKKSNRNSVTVDVRTVRDVETALKMIEIVTEVK